MEGFNVYDLMHSAEIREYLRTHKTFTPLEQGQIIAKSYYPVEDKIYMLHQLAGQASGEDKAAIEETAKVLSAALEEIYHPAGRVLFALSRYSFNSLSKLNEYDIFRECQGLDGIYDSFEEMLKACEDYRVEESALYYVDMIKVSDSAPSEVIMHMQISYMDGRYRIWDIGVDNKWEKEHGIEKDTVDSLIDLMFRYSLSFRHGSRVKIQTPFMSKPLYGRMRSSRDGNGCWYHFFEGRHNGREVFIDVSYGTLGIGEQLSVFDWLESAEEDKEPDIADNADIPGLTYPYERAAPISKIKKCGDYRIAGRVTEAEIVEREPSGGWRNKALRITVEDETGSIPCYLTFDSSDNNCITELCGTERKIVLSGTFLEDENGHMYMDYEVDTYIVS